MNKLLVFQGNGVIDTYFGSMSDYLESREDERIKKSDKKVVKKEVVVDVPVAKEKKKLTYMEQKEWDSIEDDIESIESRMEAIQTEMVENASDAPKLQDLQKELNAAEISLEEKMERWEYLSQFIED